MSIARSALERPPASLALASVPQLVFNCQSDLSQGFPWTLIAPLPSD
jgi:hypothetical protein